jgi:cytochrome c
MIEHSTRRLAGIPLVACALAATPALALNADAAMALVKKSDCLKCQAVDKKKDGPPFRETATKYKDKPDAAAKLYLHLTTNPQIKIDGKEEEHVALKAKNEAEVRNVVEWILSR